MAYCWRYPRHVLLALGGSVVATLMTVAIPLIQRDIVDNSIISDHQPIWIGAAALVIVAVINFGGVYTRRYIGGRVSPDGQHGPRAQLFGALKRVGGGRQ